MPQRSHTGPIVNALLPCYICSFHHPFLYSSHHQIIRFSRQPLTKATPKQAQTQFIFFSSVSSGTIDSNSETTRPTEATVATATSAKMSPPSANIFALLSTDADPEPVSDSPPSSPTSTSTSTESFTTAPSSPATPFPPSSPIATSTFTPILSKRTLKRAALASTRRNGGPDAGPVGKGSAAPTIMGRKVASSWLDCTGQWHFVYEDELVKNHDREPGRRVLRGKGKGVIRNRK